jgi:hypothetical protein
MIVCNIPIQRDVATVCRLWHILQLSFIWCIWYAHVCIIKTSNVFLIHEVFQSALLCNLVVP